MTEDTMTDLHQIFVQNGLQSKVVRPNDDGSFPSDSNTYWSNQESRVKPAVIFRPTSSDDVARAVKILADLNGRGVSAPFAVRSGGHTAWAGSANVQGGVTIDLRALNNLTVHPDRRRVTIQPGMSWVEAFAVLDEQGLAISGGRSGAVGVGGLSLGGGLSYLSPREGFVSDNIISYELVIASGAILTVTKHSHKDLWLALKGGGNNFGIVTSFEVAAIENTKIWYGNWYYGLDTADRQFTALTKFSLDPCYDRNATVMLSFGFKAGAGEGFVATPVYTQPEERPKALKEWTEIPNFMTTARITTLADALKEQAGMSGGEYQQLFETTTFYANESLLRHGFDLWAKAKSKVADIPGIVFSMTYHPVPQATIKASHARGGNSLGLDGVTETLIIALCTATWENESDDVTIQKATSEMFDALVDKAKEMNRHHPLIYLNYANKHQDVIKGYGEKVREKLIAVSRRYDPEGLFQKALSGGFKVTRA